MKLLQTTFLLLFITFCVNTTEAQNAQQKGLAIATTQDQANNGFQSSKSDLTMVLKNRKGQESVRQLVIKKIETANDGDQSLIIFDTPKDLKGTVTLTHTHKVGSDDQWVYLPAVGRVKRIASDNKSGPFVGSEYAYEDLISSEIEKYTYKYLGTAEGLDKVERVPLDKNSGYTKQIVYHNLAKNARVEKIEYYDRKGVLLKTLTGTQWKLYLGKYWKAHLANMVNHQTGKSTSLNVSVYKLNAGLSASEFTQDAMKRTRS